MAKDKGDAGKTKDPVRKLRKLIKNIRVAMLTTAARDGSLRSRPMATQESDSAGELWFFTRYRSGMSEEIQENQRVNLSYASPKNERYVSVSGTASLVRDPDRIKDLWRGELKEWFPDGKKDPDLALLKITIDRAQFWDNDESRMVDLLPQAAPRRSAPAERTASRAEEAPAPGGAMG
jgi:general stress protein 26